MVPSICHSWYYAVLRLVTLEGELLGLGAYNLHDSMANGSLIWH